MIAELHIAGKRAHQRERALELRFVLRCHSVARAQTAPEHHVVRLAAVLHLHRPGSAAVGVSRRQKRREQRATDRHCVAVVNCPVDRMLFAAGSDGLKGRHVFGHDNDLRARALLHQCIAFLVIAMRVIAEEDLDVARLETQLLDRVQNDGHVPLVGAVDEDVTLRRRDEERRQRSRSNVVDVPDDFVGRKCGRLILLRPHVAGQNAARRVALAADSDGWMVWWRLPLSQGQPCACSRHEQQGQSGDADRAEVKDRVAKARHMCLLIARARRVNAMPSPPASTCADGEEVALGARHPCLGSRMSSCPGRSVASMSGVHEERYVAAGTPRVVAVGTIAGR